jgi:flagellar hook-length control protein FliK
MQNAATKTDLPASVAVAQDQSKPTAADTALLNTNADLANDSKKTETTGLQTTGLPDFNRLLAAQMPAAQTSTTSSSQSLNQALSQTQSNQPAENLTGKALPSVADNRAIAAGNQKETIAQASLRDDVSSGKAAASSLSVSDAGVVAKAVSASKPESAAVESQPGTRSAPAADRPRIATVNLQQAASVQSSSNSSNVTTMAVEGLESKLAVPQNTGLQAAGLSVFQSMQRQDEPLKMEIATPITQPGFTEELKETVKLVSTRDLREVEVTINPEELGPIKLKVQMTGDKAEVTFQAENEQTRTLLAEAVPALTESLAESGIELRNALVEKPQQSLENNTGNLFQGQSQREQRNPDANFQQGQGRNGRQDNTGFDVDKKSATPDAPKRRNNGLLDTYA